jgi:hypothetical protein
MKLHQLLSLVPGKRSAATDALSSAYQQFQKPGTFEGFTKTFTQRTDDGTPGRPPEKKHPQNNVAALVGGFKPLVADMLDTVAKVDWANAGAKADVVVDGQVVIANAPVTFLLFLGKRLNELKTTVEAIPLRDPALDWTFSAEASLFVSPVVRKQVTTKEQVGIVLHPPTVEHPAQTQLITKDVVTGWWDERQFSGAVTRVERDVILARLQKLSDAVLVAREQANQATVDAPTVGGAILDFVFGTAFQAAAGQSAG